MAIPRPWWRSASSPSTVKLVQLFPGTLSRRSSEELVQAALAFQPVVS